MKALLLGLCAATAWAGPAQESFDRLAKQAARASVKSGFETIQVRSPLDADGQAGPIGLGLAERLVARLVRRRRPRLIEPGSAVEPDAVLTGTFVAFPEQVEVHFKLVSLRTGFVVVSETLVVPNEWGPPRSAAPRESAPRFSARAECRDAGSRIDELQRGVLEEKARYWARKLKLEPRRLKADGLRPGAMISDAALRLTFEERYSFWLRQAQVPELSGEQVRRFVEADGEAYELFALCRSEATGTRQETTVPSARPLRISTEPPNMRAR